MNYKHFLLVFVILGGILAACNPNTTRTETTVTVNETDTVGNAPVKAEETTLECFKYVSGRDVYTLKINRTGNDITGEMAFNNYEKDSSSGTIKGTVEGDIYKFDYDFESEGMQSISQMLFKRSGNTLIRAEGEFTEEGIRVYYVNPDQVTYTGMVFELVDCW